MPFDRLNYINNHPWMPQRREEEKRLKILSEETLLNNYRELFCQFDDFVSDGQQGFDE